jgi:hypothetical protein
MTKDFATARHIAAQYLDSIGRIIDAKIVSDGGGDDFLEVVIALRSIKAMSIQTTRLRRALDCYADPTFWDDESSEVSLAFHDRGEIARAALIGKELYEQHRD